MHQQYIFCLFIYYNHLNRTDFGFFITCYKVHFGGKYRHANQQQGLYFI